LATAIIIQLLLGGTRRRLALFGAALLMTFSGTGLVLLASGLIVLALRRGGRWAWRMALVITVSAVVVGTTPIRGVLLDRVSEFSEQGSSGNARFNAPYDLVFNAISTDLPALLVGRGAGSVDLDVNYFNPTGIPSNYPAIPKLLGEYGLPSTVVFIAFLMTLFLRRCPSAVLGLIAVVMFFFLSGALLEPPVIYLVWLLTGLFAGSPIARDAHVSVRPL
jgi:hypothetical protein